MPGVVGQGPLPGEAERLRQNAAHEERVQRMVGQPRHPAAELAQEIHRTEQPLAPGQAVALNPRVQEFGFQQRHVDVGGAFGRAGFAGEAIAQRGVQLRAAQRVAAGHAAQLERGANRVGPPARAHDFLAGGDEGRAHRGRFLAAAAAAVALLQVARERAVLRGKGQHRREGQLEFAARSLAQLGVNLEAPVGNDLARVEQVVRVERAP